MGLNITHTMGSFQFENQEQLRQNAKNIFDRQGVSTEVAERIINQTIFTAQNSGLNAQLAMIQASTQINLNNKLKDTLKYLRSNTNKKAGKTPVFGEIWDVFTQDDNTEYNGELSDFVVDLDKNIFIAA